MLSTDNNINNALRVTEIDLTRQWDAFSPNRVEYVTQEWYDLKQTHDMHTTYVITDGTKKRPRVYIGDILVTNDDTAPEYLMGINDHNEYVIYEYIKDYSVIVPILIPIKRFDTAQAALDALAAYKRVGSPSQFALMVHNALASYIVKEAGIHETIVAIIAANGYREDPRLQQLNEKALAFGCRYKDRDIPFIMRQMLHNIANKNEITLWPFYSGIYDIFVMYDFFKDSKYTKVTPEELDLHEEIDRIIKVFSS